MKQRLVRKISWWLAVCYLVAPLMVADAQPEDGLSAAITPLEICGNYRFSPEQKLACLDLIRNARLQAAAVGLCNEIALRSLYDDVVECLREVNGHTYAVDQLGFCKQMAVSGGGLDCLHHLDNNVPLGKSDVKQVAGTDSDELAKAVETTRDAVKAQCSDWAYYQIQDTGYPAWSDGDCTSEVKSKWMSYGYYYYLVNYTSWSCLVNVVCSDIPSTQN